MRFNKKLIASLSFRKSQSMYHAMGYSSMLVMQAGMTFDQNDMDAAIKSLRESLHTCEKYGTTEHKFLNLKDVFLKFTSLTITIHTAEFNVFELTTHVLNTDFGRKLE